MYYKIMTGSKNSINELILFSLYSLNGDNKKSDFSSLIKECFVRFPAVFSFQKHPQWPDARKLDRPLRDLRKKKLIVISPQGLFKLTSKGGKLAKEVAKQLGQRKLL
jgi:hypothetical protein